MNIPFFSLITNLLNKKADRLVGQIIPVFRMDGLTPSGTLPCDGTTYNRADYNNLWNQYLVGTKTKYYAWQTEDTLFTVWTLSEEPVVESSNPMNGPLLGNTKASNSHYVISNVSGLADGVIVIKYTPDLNDPSTFTLYSCIRRSILDDKDHILPTCSLEEYGDFIENFGQCPLWAVDLENNQFKTPLIKDGAFIQQALSGSELGKAYNPGLPNITGTIFGGSDDGPLATGGGSTGALYIYRSAWKNGANGENGAGAWDFGIDASRSSSIYGNSTTVQPAAISVRYFVTI